MGGWPFTPSSSLSGAYSIPAASLRTREFGVHLPFIHLFVVLVGPVAVQADAEPAKASHLLVSVHRCEGLVMMQKQQQQQQGTPPVQRPYAHYTPPGRSVPHDTSLGVGPTPVFEDAASWGLVKSAAAMSALQQHQLQVCVCVCFGRVAECSFARA